MGIDDPPDLALVEESAPLTGAPFAEEARREGAPLLESTLFLALAQGLEPA